LLAIIFIYTVHALRLDIDVINRSYRVHFCCTFCT